jgi:DNA (cytosine-5)-methyltransferase 1
MEKFAVRRLTPTEYWRLMGFTDSDVEKCRALGMSNTQLYKQAGNSIVTNCIELIAEHLYKNQVDSEYVCTDEKFSQSKTGGVFDARQFD